MSFDEYTNAIVPTDSVRDRTETPAATIAFPAIASAQSFSDRYLKGGTDLPCLKLKIELPEFFKFTDILIDPACEFARDGAISSWLVQSCTPQTSSYRSISSYWAPHSGLPKRELDHIAVSALVSFLDTTGASTDTQ
jgi:hypothetical protein